LKRACVHRLAAVLFGLSLFLGSYGLSAAEPPKPIITTPTPTPRPTPIGGYAEADLPHRLHLPVVVFEPRPLHVSPDAFSHEVLPGETLWTLALDYGRDLDTMSCTTDPRGPDAETLTAGQVITIPALADLCYTVRPGDTLYSIAARYGLSLDEIVAAPWNALGDTSAIVTPRQRILLPGARRFPTVRADPSTVSRANDRWAWPVVGPISQGARPGHMAIDIAVPLGTPIKAADRGTVMMAGWNPSGYGFRVVIDHGNDYVTLYAHLSDIYVEEGQVVGEGQVIGVSGANGNITGPHLHFELRDFGILRDPLQLLPD